MKRWFVEDNIRRLNKIRASFNLPLIGVKDINKGPREARLPVKSETTAVAIVEKPRPKVTAEDLVGAVVDIRDSLETQQGEGDVITENLNLTSEIKDIEFRHPITRRLQPLLTATIYNKGPSAGRFIINYPNSDVIILDRRDQQELDFRKDKKKFHRLFYYCPAGSVTLARVHGKF